MLTSTKKYEFRLVNAPCFFTHRIYSLLSFQTTVTTVQCQHAYYRCWVSPLALYGIVTNLSIFLSLYPTPPPPLKKPNRSTQPPTERRRRRDTGDFSDRQEADRPGRTTSRSTNTRRRRRPTAAGPLQTAEALTTLMTFHMVCV